MRLTHGWQGAIRRAQRQFQHSRAPHGSVPVETESERAGPYRVVLFHREAAASLRTGCFRPSSSECRLVVMWWD